MPWVKLTDDWYDDPKIVAAGPVCLAMWVVGLSWCARNLTDGFIPFAQARRLLDWEGIAWRVWSGEMVGGGEDVDANAVAESLVFHGLWEHVDGGFRVANYHRYQPSRASVLAARERDRQRKSGRSAVPEPDSVPAPHGEQTDSVRIPAAPVPDPVPISRQSSSQPQVGACPQAADDDTETAVWTEYARLKRQASTTPVRNHRSYDARTIANGKAELGETLARWLALYDATPSEYAAGLVEGVAGRYWTRRTA